MNTLIRRNKMVKETMVEKLRNEKLMNLAIRVAQDGCVNQFNDLIQMATGETKTRIKNLEHNLRGMILQESEQNLTNRKGL